MAVNTLTIDSKPVTARAGETLLQAAAEAGIWIPTLCHLEGLSEAAACRLCLVEVEGNSKLVPACVTEAAENMVVRTESPRLQEYRKMIIELFLVERNHVCSVCVANHHCELQDLAVKLGVDHVRYDYLFPEHKVDLSHRLFGLDHNRCILCTRCVRTCDEIEGAHTWDVAGRGVQSWMITDMNQPWGESSTCTSCGKCVQACPTGALFHQSTPVAGVRHERGRLELLIIARERREWNV